MPNANLPAGGHSGVEPDTQRMSSIDLLRGLVMIVMTLDHVRDFIHQGAMSGSPTDLSTTTPLLFATRWITHVCAPAFALTAGIGAYLWWQKSRSRARLSKFLVTRGLWLMLLEVVAMRFAYYFSFSAAHVTPLLVLWSLGLSMVALGALIWLPRMILGSLAVATIFLHPLLAGIRAEDFGPAAGLWNILYQVGTFEVGGLTFLTPYPLIPWLAVMALGFALGPLFLLPTEERRRLLMRIGLGALACFLVLRLTNFYGDPVPWSAQPPPIFTALSFLNVTKYPVSPSFLMLTLGVSFLLLVSFERVGRGRDQTSSAVATLGRVPLFYYVLHFYVAHIVATLLAVAQYGGAALAFVFMPYPSFGGPAEAFPTGFGHDLWVVFLIWLAVLAICYPACRLIAAAKSRRRHWWLAYL